MLRHSSVLLISLVIIGTTAMHLHLLDNTQAQIDALKAQQDKFVLNVNKLITNISQIQKSINSTTNIDQKVMLLENAIISERQSVFELSKIIIPPFNVTKDGCQKMTDQQKVQLLEQLAQAKKEIYELKNISLLMPKCDDVDQIKRDIQKQIFFLNSIESIIYTNCSMNVILSPTIFQTNIYAPNWVLGNMTIDDLIEQYYQRSIRYDNITNCPIDFPFFDGKQCITCPQTAPAFDISQKKCVACPPDYRIDNDQKKCVPLLHYTNWTGLNNFSPLDGPFPTPDPLATPCPKEVPYYNGTGCMQCNLPLYFDIASQTCKKCDKGTAFSINEGACSKLQKNMLTRLSSTRWVTGPNNFTNVLQERANILTANETSGIYSECPVATPYYDGITCVDCGGAQFDLNTRRCITAPANNQFDPNIHTYIPPQTAETIPNAPNLLGQQSPDDPSIPNCNQTNPYYDGVGCIACPNPFIYFDLNSKTCVVCDPQTKYNSTTKTCEPRPIIYISNNTNNWLATPNRSPTDYQNNITTTIKNNPDAIILNCTDNSQYSDYKTCFNCATNQYFNIETLKCQVCPDIYNTTTKLCDKPIYTFTNLNAPNIINLANPKGQIKNITSLLSQNNLSSVCPLETPYYNGKACITCSPPNIFFDYVNKVCSGCPSNYFLTTDGKCMMPPTVSNISALTASKAYIETKPNDTIAAMTQQIQSYKTQGTPYLQCKQSQPYYNYTTGVCTSLCSPGSYIDFATTFCVFPPQVSNVTAIAAAKTYVETPPNGTLSALSQVAQNYKAAGMPYVECPTSLPFYNTNTSTCTSLCTGGNYIDLATGNCIVPNKVSNVSALNTANNYLESTKPNGTLAAINQTIQNLKTAGTPYAECPQSNPYYSSTLGCIACPSGSNLDLATGNCIACAAYNPSNHTCSPVYVSNVPVLSSSNSYIQTQPNGTIAALNQVIQNYNATGTPYQPCPASTPFFNTTSQKCVPLCPNGTILYLNLGTSSCVPCLIYNPTNHTCTPVPVTNVPAIQSAGNYIETPPTATLANFTQSAQNLIASGIPNQLCPTSTPYYNTTSKTCVPLCPTGTYLDIASGYCVICPNYNATIHQCPPPQPKYPNMNNTYWTSSNLTQVQQWRNNLMQKPNATICPIDTPYYNNYTCINCPANQFFNYDTLKCQSCPAPLVFDANAHKCLQDIPDGLYQTNVNSPGVIYGDTPKAQWQSYYNSNVTTYPNIKDCPAPTLYYDGINCVECPSGFYFNLQTRQCMRCPTGTIYDGTTNPNWKGCVDTTSNQQVSIPPDIAKMYANIF